MSLPQHNQPRGEPHNPHFHSLCSKTGTYLPMPQGDTPLPPLLPALIAISPPCYSSPPASVASAAAPSPLLLPPASAASAAAPSPSASHRPTPATSAEPIADAPTACSHQDPAVVALTPAILAATASSPSAASSSVGHHSSSPPLHHRQPSLPSPTAATATHCRNPRHSAPLLLLPPAPPSHPCQRCLVIAALSLGRLFLRPPLFLSSLCYYRNLLLDRCPRFLLQKIVAATASLAGHDHCLLPSAVAVLTTATRHRLLPPPHHRPTLIFFPLPQSHLPQPPSSSLCHNRIYRSHLHPVAAT
ncbi:hypothetical protein BHE74_00046078 [Ensete ventricosum]|nr:hypothetical protein BHE74_00046078 [Ensete ventricosum]